MLHSLFGDEMRDVLDETQQLFGRRRPIVQQIVGALWRRECHNVAWSIDCAPNGDK